MASGKRAGRGIKDRNVGSSAGIRPYKLDLGYATTTAFVAAKSLDGENTGSGEAGDFFFDTTTNEVRFHDGTNWSRDIKYTEVSLTAAQIKAIATTPQTLVASQGAGKVVEFLSAVLILDHGGTDFATYGDLAVRYTDGSGTIVSDTAADGDFLHSAADAIHVIQALSADTALTAGAALVLDSTNGDPVNGDGVLRIKVSYRVHTTGL